MPELDALLKDHDIRLTITVPVFSSDMAQFIANYRYQSPAHLGEAIDGVLASAEFQALVNRARRVRQSDKKQGGKFHVSLRRSLAAKMVFRCREFPAIAAAADA
jgi:hypothetical protein